jgi:hypothetical protein
MGRTIAYFPLIDTNLIENDKISSDIQTHRHTDIQTGTHTYRQTNDLISLLSFFKIRKVG